MRRGGNRVLLGSDGKQGGGVWRWMCCFYPGNVICLNAPHQPLCSTGGLVGSCARFSLTAVTVGPRLPMGNFCRKHSYSALLHPPQVLNQAPAGLLGAPANPQPLLMGASETTCGQGQHCLRPSANRDVGVLQGKQRKRRVRFGSCCVVLV